MHIGKGMNIRVIDSFNHLPMTLSKLPRAFGLSELKKGYFNTKANQNYVGDYPDAKFYSPEFMSAESRTAFLKWYAEKKCLISRKIFSNIAVQTWIFCALPA